jgi:hypothetical protein
MNRRLLTNLCGSLSLASLLLACGWAYWDAQPTSDAWICDCPEQVPTPISPGQKVKVGFRLKNTSRRSLRILGTVVC